MIFGMSMSMSVGTYYAKYVLGNENFAGFLMAAGTLPVILFIPVIPIFVRKIGKAKVSIIGGFISVLAYALMLVNPADMTWLLICNVIKGIGSSATMATTFAMVADSIEYGHWKTGKRTEGMLYSSTTFGAKVGGGIGTAIGMTLLGKAGYDGLLAVQNPAVISTMTNLYIIVPIFFSLAMPIILMVFYKLDKIYPQVIEELEEREAKHKK